MTNFSPDFDSELRSIQRYVSFKFDDKEIRRYRPDEDVTADILIAAPVPTVVDPHNHAVSFTTTSFVIYYNAVDYDDAIVSIEKFTSLFEFGVDVNDHTLFGHKRRIPLWQWQEGTTAPPNEAVKGYMRVLDLSLHLLDAEEPKRFVVSAEFKVQSFRVTYDDSTQPTLTTVNPSTGGVT